MVWREDVWVRERVYGLQRQQMETTITTNTTNVDGEQGGLGDEKEKANGPPPLPKVLGLPDLEIESVQKFEMVAPGPASYLRSSQVLRWVLMPE